MGVPINYNLRNLVERKGTTLMTALGIGLTVAVLVTSIAMTTGHGGGLRRVGASAAGARAAQGHRRGAELDA